MSDTPLIMCPPTTGCGKAMQMVRTTNLFPEGWTVPEKCPHCGKQQFPSSVYMVKYGSAESQPILSGTELSELNALYDKIVEAWS